MKVKYYVHPPYRKLKFVREIVATCSPGMLTIAEKDSLKNFFSKTIWPILLELGMEHLAEKDSLKNFFSKTIWPILLELGMEHLGLQSVIVGSIYDPRMTLAYFTANSIFKLKFL